MAGLHVVSAPSDIWQWLVQTFARVGHALAGFFHHVVTSISHGFRSLGLDRLLNAVVVLAHAIMIGLAFLLALAMIVMSITFLLMITATLISYARRKARQRTSVRIRMTMDSASPEEPIWRQRPVLPVTHQHTPRIPQFTAGQHGAHSQWMHAVQELRNEDERRRRAASRLEQTHPRWAQRNAFVHTFLCLHESAYGDADDCIICLESLGDAGKRIGKLHCGHVFHLDCVMLWFSSRDELSCPMCRQVYSDEEAEYGGPSSYGTV